MIDIPHTLQNPVFRFVRVEQRGKRPIDLEWTTKNNFEWNNDKLQ
jgi:hypothetical protein